MNTGRKAVSLFLALTLSLSLTAPALAAQDDWYRDAARWAQERALIAPEANIEQPVTAGELSAMLSQLTGGSIAEGTAALTRMEAVTMLSEALRPASSATDWHPFTDAPESNAALAWAWADGIVLGTGDGVFSPDALCSRAQALTMLYRWVLRHPDYALRSVYTMDSQSIGLTGMGNARELGGYVMGDGRTVKHGLLLRAAKPADGTEEDLNKLREIYQLAEFADFRMEREIAQAPEPELEGVTYRWLPIMDTELLAQRSAAMAKGLAQKGVDL